jgi:hypothetical protein
MKRKKVGIAEMKGRIRKVVRSHGTGGRKKNRVFF